MLKKKKQKKSKIKAAKKMTLQSDKEAASETQTEQASQTQVNFVKKELPVDEGRLKSDFEKESDGELELEDGFEDNSTNSPKVETETETREDDNLVTVQAKIKNKSKKKETKKKETVAEMIGDSHSVDTEDEGSGGEESEKFYEKKEQQDIEEKLIEIYENTDGSMPDMKTFKQRGGGKFWKSLLIFLVSCVFLAAVAWVGLFVLQDGSKFSEEDVILSISGEEEVSSGEEVTYRIRYRNAQNVPLEKAILEVRYPNGFVFVSSSVAASNERNDSWNLGILESQESGFIDITGRAFGDLNSQQSLRVFLNYVPTNFSSEFQKVSHIAFTVKESPIDLGVEIVPEIAIGLDTQITISVKPRDGEKIQNIALVCELDGGFNINSSEPKTDEMERCQWSFDELTQEQKIVISGSFNANEENNGNLVIKVLGWDSRERDGDGYVLASQTAKTSLIETDLSLSLAVNGGMGKMNVSPGEILTTSIVLKNSGQSAIEDGVVRMVWDAPSYNNRSILDWSKIDTQYDANISGEQINENLRRGNIIWNKSDIPELGRIEPGDEINIDFSIPIRNSGDAQLNDFNTFEIKGLVELQYDRDGQHTIQTSNELTLKIQSDLNLEVRDEVSQDEEDRDVHLVTWLLSNSFHNLDNIRVKADIYGDFELSEDDIVVPAGEVEFDPEAKRLVWTIDQMPTSVDVLAMRFSVVLNNKNPSQINLTSKAEVTAEDTVTGEEIIVVGDEILLK